IREINPKFGLGNKDRQKSPYEILGVLPTDSFESIKKRYKELMIKFHPDNLYSKNLDKEFMEFATAKVKEINWAYEKIKEERGVG
ncbi:MAG: DnaJ domain-containing protein, partial [Epsilonproteobacteria bacterium]|nr:DnaJ domain-containing protein [Campylobacterota bacterium]